MELELLLQSMLYMLFQVNRHKCPQKFKSNFDPKKKWVDRLVSSNNISVLEGGLKYIEVSLVKGGKNQPC